MVVDNRQRHRRLRLLLKKLNKERKRQAQKTDILCNDLIAAQRSFIKRLKTISFTANLYESIIGTTDLNDLLYTAARIIRTEDADANVTFFLRSGEDASTDLCAGFELHTFESSPPITFEKQHSLDGARDRLENCFGPELMNSICTSNAVCTLEDMFAMDVQGNLTGLNNISAATFPLGVPGSSSGFMLVYRSSEHKLTADEIDRIRAVTCGLSRAIDSCQALARASSRGDPHAAD